MARIPATSDFRDADASILETTKKMGLANLQGGPTVPGSGLGFYTRHLTELSQPPHATKPSSPLFSEETKTLQVRDSCTDKLRRELRLSLNSTGKLRGESQVLLGRPVRSFPSGDGSG